VKNTVLLSVALFLVACAGPSVTRTQSLPESADAPYNNLLVVTVFESFDIRRNFEDEIVGKLKDKGIDAVASTSMMDTTVPLNRDTLLAMVDKLDSDAVLLTQLVHLDTASQFRRGNVEATRNIRPTYYFNVWNVELTEYKEPKGLELEHEITMATQVFSINTKGPVWAIETNSQLKRDINQQTTGTSREAEAKGIVNAMSRDGVIGRK